MIYSCNAVWRMLCEERDPWEAGQMLERMIVHLEDPEAEEKFCPSGCPDCPGGFELSTWDVPSMINAIWLTFTKGPMRVSPNCVAKVGVGRFGCFASVAGDYGPPKIAWEATEAMLEVGQTIVAAILDTLQGAFVCQNHLRHDCSGSARQPRLESQSSESCMLWSMKYIACVCVMKA